MKQKGLAPILILIGILLISGVVGGIYYLKIRKTESFEQRLSRQNPILFPSISPQQNNKPTPDIPQNDETVNWKIYEDQERKISFKYPAQANVKIEQAFSMLSSEVSDAITIETPWVDVNNQGYIIDMVVRDNAQNLSAKSLIDGYISEIEKKCSPPGCALPQKIRSTLQEYKKGEVSGYIFRIGGETDSVMVVQVEYNKIYIFRVSNGNGYATEQGIKIFDQVLSTFRFLP